MARSVEDVQQRVFAARMVLKTSLAGEPRMLGDRLQLADSALVEVMNELGKLQDSIAAVTRSSPKSG